MKNTTIVSAIFAVFSLTTTAFAQEGTYYDGTERAPQVAASASRDVSYGYTGSINNPSLRNGWDTAPKAINSGDYYGGAERPN